MAHSWVSELEACTLAWEPELGALLEVEEGVCMQASWMVLVDKSALEAVVGTAPAPTPVAAGRCGLEGGRRRLCVEQEAALEGPGRQALKLEEEERACCRFALGAACIGASACTLALEVHMLALEGHRRASLVGEGCKLA